jgi:hypothetical protein
MTAAESHSAAIPAGTAIRSLIGTIYLNRTVLEAAMAGLRDVLKLAPKTRDLWEADADSYVRIDDSLRHAHDIATVQYVLSGGDGPAGAWSSLRERFEVAAVATADRVGAANVVGICLCYTNLVGNGAPALSADQLSEARPIRLARSWTPRRGIHFDGPGWRVDVRELPRDKFVPSQSVYVVHLDWAGEAETSRRVMELTFGGEAELLIPDLLGHKLQWLAGQISGAKRHGEIEAARVAVRRMSEEVIGAMADPLQLESLLPSMAERMASALVVRSELATKVTELRMQEENLRHLGGRGAVRRLYKLYRRRARIVIEDATLRLDSLSQVVDRLRSVLELATARLQARQTVLAERRSGAAQQTANAIGAAGAVIGTSAIVDKDVAAAMLQLVGVRNSDRLQQLCVQVVVIAAVTALVVGALALVKRWRRAKE